MTVCSGYVVRGPDLEASGRPQTAPFEQRIPEGPKGARLTSAFNELSAGSNTPLGPSARRARNPLRIGTLPKCSAQTGPDNQDSGCSRRYFFEKAISTDSFPRGANYQAPLLPKLSPSLASPWLSTMFFVSVLFCVCTPAYLAELLELRCAVLMERALRN